MKPLVSIVLCTHNRAIYLTKAIKSLLEQSLPNETFEIIVVDNFSTDSTKQVVEKFSKLANIRYLFEQNLGLSYSLNTGRLNANAEYIAYLDDDALASKNWIEKIVEVYENVEPKPRCVGVLVVPIWEKLSAAWLSGWLLQTLTIIDWTELAHTINDLNTEWLVGTNIAFRRAILEGVWGFR